MHKKRKDRIPFMILFVVLNLVLGLLFTGAAENLQERRFTVTYDNNAEVFVSVVDYTGAGSYQLQPYAGKSGNLLKPLYDSRPEGKVFTGWHTSPTYDNKRGVFYEPDAVITVERDVLLYAVWVPVVEEYYSVIYNLRSSQGLGSGFYEVKIAKENGQSKYEHAVLNWADIKAESGAKEPAGYEFAGWYRQGSAAQEIQPGYLLSSNQDEVLYVKWQQIKEASSVILYHPGEAPGSALAGISVGVGEKHQVINPADYGITYRGHSFQGWQLTETGRTYQAGETFTVPVANQVYTFKAQWKTDGGDGGGGNGGGNGGGGGGDTTYRVTYQPNNDTNEQSVVESGYSWGATVTVKDGATMFSAPEGKEFGGWSERAGGSRYYSANERFTITRDETLYAIWVDADQAQLNYEDHFAYIVGYTDGTVRPENNVTREEATTIFFRLLSEQSRTRFLAASNDYHDVKNSDWSNVAISTLTKAGIVKGEKSGNFRPQDSISRAELAVIASHFNETSTGTTPEFTDTAGHWAQEAIAQAARAGWVSGYKDGSFRPDNPITRAELITLVNNVQNRHVDGPDNMQGDMVTFVDNSDTSKWYYAAVQEATNSHYYIRSDGVNETWTELRANFDWATLERPK